jgi:hypothetical protein
MGEPDAFGLDELSRRGLMRMRCHDGVSCRLARAVQADGLYAQAHFARAGIRYPAVFDLENLGTTKLMDANAACHDLLL